MVNPRGNIIGDEQCMSCVYTIMPYRPTFLIVEVCSLLVASSHLQHHAFLVEDYLLLQVTVWPVCGDLICGDKNTLIKHSRWQSSGWRVPLICELCNLWCTIWCNHCNTWSLLREILDLTTWNEALDSNYILYLNYNIGYEYQLNPITMNSVILSNCRMLQWLYTYQQMTILLKQEVHSMVQMAVWI